MLPDVALLKIFDFYEDEEQIEAWHTLVHVCRKWRNVVFGSPLRLNLRLCCKARTPVREMLDLWPPLPIIIKVYNREMLVVDDILAALEHNDRVLELELDISSSLLEKILAEMKQPFPALTRLLLEPRGEAALVVPASFLGGSAPRLQTLFLDYVPFPGLPKLLLSATHLVDLTLLRIPHSGYFSPEAIVTGLSVLTSLEKLGIKFKSPRSRPDQNNRRPPPPTRTLLPVLTKFWFKGVCEYLEDFLARIDAPLLNNFSITFFHQLIFDTPQLTRFISRTPNLKAHYKARVFFSSRGVLVTLPQTLDGVFKLRISCRQSDWQLSSLAQICSSFFSQALIPAVEQLYILNGHPKSRWQDDIENSQWVELFNTFIAVKDLYVSREFAPRIAPALQELVGEGVTEVLPTLQSLLLEETLDLGSDQEITEQFVTARRVAGRPITISRCERKHFI
jgi:hypothetical protein